MKEFNGAIVGLDKDTEKFIGKLLINEKDENIYADSKTFSRLYAMVGGSKAVMMFILPFFFFRYIEV